MLKLIFDRCGAAVIPMGVKALSSETLILVILPSQNYSCSHLAASSCNDDNLHVLSPEIATLLRTINGQVIEPCVFC